MNKQASHSKTPGAVIYTRVSTGDQDKHGTSPETQRDACRAKALALSLPIVAEHYDGGVSGGFLLARKEFQAAIADIKAGRADTLICPNISRYSRDVEHQQAVKKAVKAAGGRLIFCDMTFEDTAAGDLNFTIQGGFAEYERKTIYERTYGGHKRRAGQGIQSARVTSPFGYVIPKAADILRGTFTAEHLGKYLLVEGKAEAAAKLFTLYDSGAHSLNDLSKRMNRSGIPTPGGGAMWRASTIRYILTNPVYKGVAVFGRFDHSTDEQRLMQTHPQTGLPLTSAKSMRKADPATWITMPCPALVTEDVWERVQQRLADGKRFKGGNPDTVRMLSGRVHCPECGKGMFCASATHAKSKKPGSSEVFTYPARYQCLHYRQTLMEIGEKGCVPTGYYVHQVEQAVIAAVLEACQNPEAIREAVAAWQRRQAAPSPPTDARQEIAAIEKALRALEARHTATVRAQIEGIMAGADPGAYNAVFGELAAERKDLEDRRGSLSRSLRASQQPKRAGERAPDAGQLLEAARRVLTSADVAGTVKRDIVGTIIERVYCLKAADKSAGARVVFLPGVMEEIAFGDTLQTPSGVCKEPMKVIATVIGGRVKWSILV